MPSVTAEDPALKPARIAEGILPLRMRRGNFVISGAMWHKFNASRPWLTFPELWLLKECVYNCRNAQSKLFLIISRVTRTSIMRSFVIVLFDAKLNAC